MAAQMGGHFFLSQLEGLFRVDCDGFSLDIGAGLLVVRCSCLGGTNDE